MKNTKTFKVAMLPTEKADDKVYSSPIYMEKEKLYGCYDINYNIRLSIPQHLHIISNDEIKEGDKWINLQTNNVHDCKDKNHAFVINQWLENNKKVISSTDKSITPNSWIPESFINAYVKAFNEGKPITEVNLEMDDLLLNEFKISKTRPDGSVVIHQSKMYSRSEVLAIIDKLYEEIDSPTVASDKWIEENL